MLEPVRVEYDSKPDSIQRLGDLTYYYNYDILLKQVTIKKDEESEEEIVTRWYCVLVHLRGTPDCTRCILLVIRAYISQEDEMNLLNKYNGYNVGIHEDSSAVDEYIEYISLVSAIKSNVEKDFKIESLLILSELSPRLADMINLLKILIQSTELSDQQAIQCKSLYPLWKSYIGKSLLKDTKVTYKGKLFKVKQEVNPVLEIYPPSTDTASLYEEINETNAGTIDDPIPYNNNMELFEGKYYILNEIKYLCIRNTEQPVYQDLEDLVGNYVQVAEE